MPAREGQRGVPRPCGLNFIDAIPGPEIGQNEASTALLVGSRLQISAEDGPLKGMEEASVKAASGLEAVYRTDGPAIWRALIAFTGDTAVAEDAQSEALAQALARGDALRDPTRWIWRVAFRVAAAELKDRRHRSAELLQEPAVDLPESIVDVVRALRRLSPNQRMAVVLHDYADRSVTEVAATLGSTRATVYVHLSQGRKRLRAMMEEDDA